MATSTSSSAKVPVSMMEVKKMVTGPGSSSESAYIFAMNMFTGGVHIFEGAPLFRRVSQPLLARC